MWHKLLMLNLMKMSSRDHKNMSKISWENCNLDLEKVEKW